MQIYKRFLTFPNILVHLHRFSYMFIHVHTFPYTYSIWLVKIRGAFDSKGMDTLRCAFDPELVVPQAFNFGSKEKRSKEKRNSSETTTTTTDKLRKRIALAMFSKTIGWRPGGLQAGQCKLYVTRFPQEFRKSAMQRIILPKKGNLPYVTPENLLPCPWLATCNALKILAMNSEWKKDADPRAVSDIEMVLEDGVQVEWVDMDSYMDYMLYCEGAAVQQAVSVAPHIVDTAMMFLTYLSGRQAQSLNTGNPEVSGAALAVALSSHGQAIHDAFLAKMSGGSKVHRMQDMKALLTCSVGAKKRKKKKKKRKRKRNEGIAQIQ